MVMSLVSGGMAYTMDTFSKNSGSADSQKPSMQDEMGSALGSQLGQATIQLLQRNVNIKPTLEIRPGYRFNLVVVKDIAFDRPYVAAR
jgi:type IV secretion system protein VirB10